MASTCSNAPTTPQEVIHALTLVRDKLEQIEVCVSGMITKEHILISANWMDRVECLLWAIDAGATPSEMRAWHRAQQGLDLFGIDND